MKSSLKRPQQHLASPPSIKKQRLEKFNAKSAEKKAEKKDEQKVQDQLMADQKATEELYAKVRDANRENPEDINKVLTFLLTLYNKSKAQNTFSEVFESLYSTRGSNVRPHVPPTAPLLPTLDFYLNHQFTLDEHHVPHPDHVLLLQDTDEEDDDDDNSVGSIDSNEDEDSSSSAADSNSSADSDNDSDNDSDDDSFVLHRKAEPLIKRVSSKYPEDGSFIFRF